MAISNKLQELIDLKQDIKEAIENKGVDLTDVAFAGYAEKIDELPAVVELTQAQYDALQGETWVINETIINDYNSLYTDINFSVFNVYADAYIPYESFDIRYDIDDNRMLITYWQTPALQDAYEVYNGSEWTEQDYRTIIFETAPTGDLLTWLEANAVKQTGGYDDNTYYLIVEE